MALTPTFQVNYTPEIAGCHIVFFNVVQGEITSPLCSYTDEVNTPVGQARTIYLDLSDFFSEGGCLEGTSILINKCEDFTINFTVVPCCDGVFKEFQKTVDYQGDC